VVTSLNTSRQKTKNLRANPAVTVFLLDLARPARRIIECHRTPYEGSSDTQ
jgi:hypothetical protein